MKKKIILSVVITVLFAIIIITTSFVTIVNMEEVKRTKSVLEIYNSFLAKQSNWNEMDLKEFKINDVPIRVTIVNGNGQVIFDTIGNLEENHSNRKEIIQAFKEGTGYNIRYSDTAKRRMVYFASKISDDLVIRSSISLSSLQIADSDYFIYYVITLISVVLFSLALAVKLVRIIVQPVKELETVTSKIAAGELSKRAIVYNYDEIGSLAKTFNLMAEQLQQRMYESFDKQNKLEAILESMDSGVIAVDNNNNILLINPYAKRLFDLKGDIIGKKVSECIIDYDLINFIKKVPDFNSREIKLFHPFEREIRVKKAPIISNTSLPIGVVITLSDITDIKRLENMRSEFVANVSHELKTPLTSIKGFSETLKYVQEEETKNKFLDIINKEAERLTRLINDILVLSNIENMHRMVENTFKPIEVIKDAIDMVNIKAKDRNIDVKLDNNFEGELLGDSDKFYQLILNLIENAVKYSNDNSEVIITTVEIRNNLVIEVADKGIGIPEGDLPRIFERFYRVDKSRASKGTGLGLAIVKHIVKLFNGEIDVESTLGEGTIFRIKIRKYYNV